MYKFKSWVLFPRFISTIQTLENEERNWTAPFVWNNIKQPSLPFSCILQEKGSLILLVFFFYNNLYIEIQFKSPFYLINSLILENRMLLSSMMKRNFPYQHYHAVILSRHAHSYPILFKKILKVWTCVYSALIWM